MYLKKVIEIISSFIVKIKFKLHKISLNHYTISEKEFQKFKLQAFLEVTKRSTNSFDKKLRHFIEFPATTKKVSPPSFNTC